MLVPEKLRSFSFVVPSRKDPVLDENLTFLSDFFLPD